MMISKDNYHQAYVWVWLPNQIEPVVAGVLNVEGKNLLFNYGKSYLQRVNETPAAIALYEPELSEIDRKLFWKRQFLNPFALT